MAQTEAHAAADIHDKGEALWMLLAFAKHLSLRIPTSHVDRLAPSDAILSSSVEAFLPLAPRLSFVLARADEEPPSDSHPTPPSSDSSATVARAVELPGFPSRPARTHHNGAGGKNEAKN